MEPPVGESVQSTPDRSDEAAEHDRGSRRPAAAAAPVAWQRSSNDGDVRDETAEGTAKITICRSAARHAFRPKTLFELGAGERRRAAGAAGGGDGRLVPHKLPRHGPLALWRLKAALSADTDGLAGIQQRASDAALPSPWPRRRRRA